MSLEFGLSLHHVVASAMFTVNISVARWFESFAVRSGELLDSNGDTHLRRQPHAEAVLCWFALFSLNDAIRMLICALRGICSAPRRMPCRTYFLSFSPAGVAQGLRRSFLELRGRWNWRTGPLWGMHFFDVRLLLRHHVCHGVDCSYRVCLAPIAGLPPGL